MLSKETQENQEKINNKPKNYRLSLIDDIPDIDLKVETKKINCHTPTYINVLNNVMECPSTNVTYNTHHTAVNKNEDNFNNLNDDTNDKTYYNKNKTIEHLDAFSLLKENQTKSKNSFNDADSSASKNNLKLKLLFDKDNNSNAYKYQKDDQNSIESKQYTWGYIDSKVFHNIKFKQSDSNIKNSQYQQNPLNTAFIAEEQSVMFNNESKTLSDPTYSDTKFKENLLNFNNENNTTNNTLFGVNSKIKGSNTQITFSNSLNSQLLSQKDVHIKQITNNINKILSGNVNESKNSRNNILNCNLSKINKTNNNDSSSFIEEIEVFSKKNLSCNASNKKDIKNIIIKDEETHKKPFVSNLTPEKYKTIEKVESKNIRLSDKKINEYKLKIEEANRKLKEKKENDDKIFELQENYKNLLYESGYLIHQSQQNNSKEKIKACSVIRQPQCKEFLSAKVKNELFSTLNLVNSCKKLFLDDDDNAASQRNNNDKFDLTFENNIKNRDKLRKKKLSRSVKRIYNSDISVKDTAYPYIERRFKLYLDEDIGITSSVQCEMIESVR